jgi:hypothetical protein
MTSDLTPAPTHSISWEIDFYGCITPTFTCHAKDREAPCLPSWDWCAAVHWFDNTDEPMDLYKPAPDDQNKPVDGRIDVWYSPAHDAWHWKYPSPPYIGPTINTGGLLEHLIQGEPK